MRQALLEKNHCPDRKLASNFKDTLFQDQKHTIIYGCCILKQVLNLCTIWLSLFNAIDRSS